MTGTHRRFVSTLMPPGREVPKPRATYSGGSGTDVLAAPRSAHIRTHLTTSKRLPTCILTRPCASGSLAYAPRILRPFEHCRHRSKHLAFSSLVRSRPSRSHIPAYCRVHYQPSYIWFPCIVFTLALHPNAHWELKHLPIPSALSFLRIALAWLLQDPANESHCSTAICPVRYIYSTTYQCAPQEAPHRGEYNTTPIRCKIICRLRPKADTFLCLTTSHVHQVCTRAHEIGVTQPGTKMLLLAEYSR